MIPEVVIYNTIINLIKKIRTDWVANTATPENSIFYRIFNGVAFGNYNYYKEAQKIILGGDDYSRSVEVNMFFNGKRAGMPTIHIHLPNEATGANSIGLDTGSFGALNQNGISRDNKARAFDARYVLVATSDNTMEVLMLYYFLKYCFISIMDNLGTIGFRNIKLSGNDINIPTEIFPTPVFSRGFAISFDYEMVVTSMFSQDIIENFDFQGEAYLN